MLIHKTEERAWYTEDQPTLLARCSNHLPWVWLESRSCPGGTRPAEWRGTPRCCSPRWTLKGQTGVPFTVPFPCILNPKWNIGSWQISAVSLLPRNSILPGTGISIAINARELQYVPTFLCKESRHLRVKMKTQRETELNQDGYTDGDSQPEAFLIEQFKRWIKDCIA